MTHFPLGTVLRNAAALSGLLALLLAGPAFADDASDVSKLMRAGQFPEALARVDSALAKNPRDAQMRFMKGVILTEQNKTADAITVFSKLTEDFPSLPEPYNNLAVLHAAAGQYEKARLALDAAIRTNPSYATAYENLGDVHAKLASQAYDKALQLDTANATAKSKLTLVRSLVGADTGTKIAAAVPAPSKPAEPARASAPESSTPIPPLAAATPAKPAPKPEAKAEAKPEAKPPAKPEAKPDLATDREQVLKAVYAWASAWSEQDMKDYLGAYRADFHPPGRTRKAWEEERRARIVGPSTISVKVESPQVTVDGKTATVRFHQVYASDRLNVNTRKTLVFDKQGGKWLITREFTGN